MLESKTNIYWDSLDYFLNRAYWAHVGYENSVDIRNKNIKEVKRVFDNLHIPVFLEGRTLENIFKRGELLVKDHDDDMGVFKQDYPNIIEFALPVLMKNGFTVIRNNEDMISIMRSNRYIDLCLFNFNGKDSIGYGKKSFLSRYYRNMNQISYNGENYYIPNDTQRYLKKRYSQSKARIKYGRKILRRLSHVPSGISRKIRALRRDYVSYLSENEFLNLNVESEGAINWELRKPHLDIVTTNGLNKKVGDIVSHFKNKDNLKKSESMIIETNMEAPFSDPIHLDRQFWQSGNNYFIYCMMYQFRKDVKPYCETNQYILNKNTPRLYSREYFESLESFNDPELAEFLSKNPIEVTNGSITSGRHRCYAMIGRLISGKPYIPFKVKLI
jgi:hypothetical protein